MVDEQIAHSGRITEITPSEITVEIISESACSSCHAASLCGMAEIKRKQVTLPAVPGYEPGEEVWVNLKRTMGFKAVWIAYVLPLLILVTDILVCSAAGAGEIFSGLSALGCVGIYYLIIYLLRGKLKNEYTFYLKKK